MDNGISIPIYLDNQASTRCDPRVIAQMAPILEHEFGNPHSSDHHHGWRAANIVSVARRSVADALGAAEAEVVFCSGATEANNLAVRGFAKSHDPGNLRIVTTAIEHKSVLETVAALTREGFETNVIAPDRDGIVPLRALEEAIRTGSAIVSVGWVNSELGVIQPIDEIASLCRRHGALLHVDASQAVGRVNVDFDAVDADLMSVSGHKCYGPKGVGALLIKRRLRPYLRPILHGGGQEEGVRSGTVSPFLATGLAAAIEIAAREWRDDERRLRDLRDRLANSISEADPDCRLNGSGARQIGGAINVTFSEIDADILLPRIVNVLSISRSSACSAGAIVGSHVLRAIGKSDEEIRRTVRLCLGRFTTADEIDLAAEALAKAIRFGKIDAHA